LLTSELLGVDSSVGGDWSYYAVPNGLALLQLVPAPDRVLAQVISSDGQVLTEGVSNVGDSFWLYTTWTNDTAYMVIRDLFEVNLASGQTKREWP
jgi:glutamine cyclotransferase